VRTNPGGIGAGKLLEPQGGEAGGGEDHDSGLSFARRDPKGKRFLLSATLAVGTS
jgi:hypothetical protein